MDEDSSCEHFRDVRTIVNTIVPLQRYMPVEAFYGLLRQREWISVYKENTD